MTLHDALVAALRRHGGPRGHVPGTEIDAIAQQHGCSARTVFRELDRARQELWRVA